ncbi:MAG: hypothetical protein PHZ02_01190 [Desulfocapsaceae bacterium]|nr:hypothetical protein [Desulfocapsaceae bacterium]
MMSTNYYLRTKICDCCHRYDEIHIGKSSVGWKFLFHVTKTLRSADDWFKEIETSGGLIFSDCATPITLEEFKIFINEKKSTKSQKEVYFKNDPKFWTDGDYDYLEGEFS